MIKINVKRKQEFIDHTLQTSLLVFIMKTNVQIMQVSNDRGIPVKFQKAWPFTPENAGPA